MRAHAIVAPALFVLACSANPANTVPTEDPGPPTAAEEAPVAPPAPPAETPPPEVASAAGCQPLAGEPDIARWRERLISALEANDMARTTEVLRCVEPSFSMTLLTETEDWVVTAIPRHLDEDPEEEWVLQLLQYSPTIGHGERTELVWIAVLDRDARGGLALAGVIARPALAACTIPNPEGFTVEYGEDAAGPTAGFEVTEQDVKACGTQVSVHYKATAYRVEGGKLVAKPLPAPPKVEWNRTATATE